MTRLEDLPTKEELIKKVKGGDILVYGELIKSF